MDFTPDENQWAKMKKHIKSDKYKPEDFFVFETLAVGDRVVPNRYTRLMPDLLSVMKDDAQKGVSLMLNHNWSQTGVQCIPIGKVFDARIEGSSQDGETTSLYTTQYILRDDSKVDGYSKNDIIKLVETGILADTSVGFSTGGPENSICSICGNSIYDFKHCEHIPGQKYIVNKDTNEVKECIVEIHKPSQLSEVGNNILMENSLVFDGAYPNAVIQSKIDNVDSNDGSLKLLEGKQELSKNDVIIGYTSKNGVELLYKHLPEKGGVKLMNEDENKVTTEEVIEENVGTEEVVNEEVVNEEVTEVEETAEEEAVEEEKPEETSEEVTESNEVEETSEANEVVETNETTENLYKESEVLEKFGNIADSLEALIQLAKEGNEIRQETIKEALNSGVRAMGNSFNKEIFTKTFSNMSTKDIKEMGEAWEKDVSEKFSNKKISKFEAEEVERNEIVDYSNFKTGNY